MRLLPRFLIILFTGLTLAFILFIPNQIASAANSCLWTGSGGDQKWTTKANWGDNGAAKCNGSYPGNSKGDTAVINTTVTITLDANIDSLKSLAELDLSSGIVVNVTGQNISLTTDLLKWTGGEFQSYNSTNQLTVTTYTLSDLSNDLTLDGATLNVGDPNNLTTSTLSNSFNLSFQSNAVLDNGIKSTLIVQSTNSWIGMPLARSGQLKNEGTLTHNPGSTHITTIDIPLNNTGTLDQKSGTLEFDSTFTLGGNVTIETGTIDTGPVNSLTITPTTFTLKHGATSAMVSTSGVSFTIPSSESIIWDGSTLSLSSAATMGLNSAVLSGTMTISGAASSAFTWNGGTISGTGSSLTVSGPAAVSTGPWTLNAASLSFDTLPVWTGSCTNPLALTGGAVLNFTEGTLTVPTCLNLLQGTVANTGSTKLDINLTGLALYSGASQLLSSGAISFSLPALTNVNWTAPNLNLNSATMTLANNTAVSAAVNINGTGLMNWTGGTLSGAGPLTVAAPANITGGPWTIDTATLALNDTSTWSGSCANLMTLTGGAVLKLYNSTGALAIPSCLQINQGALANASSSSPIDLNLAGLTLFSGGSQVFSTGSLSFALPAGKNVNWSASVLDLTTATMTLPNDAALGGSVNVNGTGLLNWTSGTLSGTGPLTVAAPASLTGGPWTLDTASASFTGATTWTGTADLTLQNGAALGLNLSGTAPGGNLVIANGSLTNLSSTSIIMNPAMLRLLKGTTEQFSAGSTTMTIPASTQIGWNGTTQIFDLGSTTLILANGGALHGPITMTSTAGITWSGGTIGGAGGEALNITGAFALTTGPWTLDHAGLNLAGVTTWSVNQNFNLSGNASLDNKTGGSLIIAPTGSVHLSGSGTFSNEGAITNNPGNTNITNLDIPFTNTGSIDQKTGTLNFSVNNAPLGGSIAFESGAIQNSFSGPLRLNLTSFSLIASGLTIFSAPTPTTSFTISPSQSIGWDGSSHLNLSTASTMSLGQATVTSAVTISGGAANAFDWTTGTITGPAGLTIAAPAVLSTGPWILDGITLNLGGTTIIQNASALTLQNSAILNNQSGSNLTTNKPVQISGSGSFTNDGTFTNNPGAAAITTIGVTLTNNGTVDQKTGSLEFDQAPALNGTVIFEKGTFKSGPSSTINGSPITFTLKAGATTALSAPASSVGFTIPASQSVTWDGASSFALSGASSMNLGQPGVTVTLGSPITISGGIGPVDWIGGTLTGPVSLTVSAPFNFQTGPWTLNAATLNLAGVSTWSGASDLTLTNNAVLDNNNTGNFTINAPADVSILGTVSESFVNDGVFYNQIGPHTTHIGVFMHNNGTIDQQTGSLAFTVTPSLVGTITFESGTFLNGPGTDLTFTSSTFDFKSGATSVLQSTTSAIGLTIKKSGSTAWDGLSAITLNGSILTVGGSGSASVNSAISISGDSTGTVAWTGGTITGTGSLTTMTQGTLSTGPWTLNQATVSFNGATTWSGSGTNPFTFSGGGTLQVKLDPGTVAVPLIFNKGGIKNNATGAFTLSPAALTLNNGANPVFQAISVSVSLNPGDSILWDNTTKIIDLSNAGLTLAQGGTVKDSFTISGNSPLTWGQGAITDPTAGASNILSIGMNVTLSTGPWILDKATLNLNSTTTLAGNASLTLQNGASFNFNPATDTINNALIFKRGTISNTSGNKKITSLQPLTLELDKAGTAVFSAPNSTALLSFPPAQSISWDDTTSTISLGGSTSLTLNGGASSVSVNGDLTITGSGQLTWAGGTFTGIASSSLTTSAPVAFSPGPWILDGLKLNLQGASYLTGPGQLKLQNHAVLDNGPTGSFTVQTSAAGDTHFFLPSTQTGTFINEGAFTNDPGAGSATIFDIAFTNTAASTIDQRSGVLQFNSSSALGGILTFENGAIQNGSLTSALNLTPFTLNLDSGGSNFFASPDSSIVINLPISTPASSVDWNGADAAANPTLLVHTLTLTGSTLTMDLTKGATGGKVGGAFTIDGNGMVNWKAGQLSGSGAISIATSLNLTTGPWTVDSATLNLSGPTTWSGAKNLFLQNGATLDNLPGGSLTINTSSAIAIALSSPTGAEVFSNEGTVTNSQAPLTINTDAKNAGVIDVQNSASLHLMKGLSGGGTLSIHNNATLTLEQDVDNQTIALLDNATLDSTSPINLNNGGLNWSGGAISGPGTLTLQNLAALNLTGTGNRHLSKPELSISGNNNLWSGSGSLMLSSGAIFFNQAGAVFTVQGSADTLIVAESGCTTCYINNAGSFIIDQGTHQLQIDSSIPLTNITTGLIDLRTGTLKVDSAIGSGGTLSVKGGLLTGSVDFTVNQLTWSGGTIGAPSPANNLNVSSASLTGSPANNMILDTRSLNVTGAFSGPTASGNLAINNGSSLNLTGGGAINGPVAVNAGSQLRLIKGSFTTNGSTVLNGSGTVEFNTNLIVSGRYNLQGTSLFKNGTVAFGGSVSLDSLGNSAVLSGGVVNLSGNLSGGGPLNIPNLSITGGTLTGANNLNVSSSFSWSDGVISGAGAFSIHKSKDGDPEAAFNISGTNPLTLDTRVLKISGNTNWTGSGQLILVNGAGLDNQANSSAAFTFHNPAPLIISYKSNLGNSSFSNEGKLVVDPGAGIGIQIDVPIINSGTIQVISGTLNMHGGGTGRSGGLIQADQNGVILFGSGSFTLDGSTTIQGPGTVQFENASTSIYGRYNVAGTSNFAGGSFTSIGLTATLNDLGSAVNVSGSVDLSDGSPLTIAKLNLSSGGILQGQDSITITTLSWTGGVIAGAGTVNATTLNASGIYPMRLDARALNISGKATWSNSSTIEMANGAILNTLNGSLCEVNVPDPNVTSLLFRGNPGDATFNNAGALLKKGANMVKISVDMANTGTIEIDNGVLSVDRGYTQSAGSTLLNGGSLSLITHGLTMNGGKLNGKGTINGEVNNHAGTLEALDIPSGSPAGLNITGNYTQGAAAEMVTKLQSGSSDSITVGGTVSLDGALTVRLFGGFSPTSGSYKVLETTSMVTNPLSGSFAAPKGLVLSSGYLLPVYNTHDVSLSVVTAMSDLSISISDGKTAVPTGSTNTYTILVTNLGPSDVSGAAVQSTFSAAFTDITWTCSAIKGSCSTPGNTGGIALTVDLASGGVARITATGSIIVKSGVQVINTVKVTSASDPILVNNSATDLDSIGNDGQNYIFLPIVTH